MLSHIVSLVSGGASGLGAATAACLVRHGARVIVADLPHQQEHFHRLAVTCCADAAKLNIHEGTVLAFADMDVMNEDQISKALDLVEKEFGEPLNALVNCAGIASAKKTLSRKREGSITSHPLDIFRNSMMINAVGSFNVARLAAERMCRRDVDEEGVRGCIINTASVAAYEGQVGQVAYAASKGAIVAMTLPMARDLAPFGIRVMTIAPGLFQTPLLDGLPQKVKDDLGQMVPLPSRLGKPDEYGELVVSIIKNPMLNGEVIRLDGALRMPP